MNRLEIEFRQELAQTMAGLWVPTIHVESHLNPGVLDLSYIMIGGDCETGWLELKAAEPVNGKIGVSVEPSQHRWMEKHAGRVPCHFLIAAGDWVYLVDGTVHRRFIKQVTHDLLVLWGTGFHREAMRSNLHLLLTAATLRSRNGVGI